jgi:hypothetical protein
MFEYSDQASTLRVSQRFEPIYTLQRTMKQHDTCTVTKTPHVATVCDTIKETI